MIATLLRIGYLNLSRDRVALSLKFLLPIVFFSIFASVFGGQGDAQTATDQCGGRGSGSFRVQPAARRRVGEGKSAARPNHGGRHAVEPGARCDDGRTVGQERRRAGRDRPSGGSW